MARKKKLFNYKFVDCSKSFNSSIIVTCNETGEKIKMYHRQLAKLIENKYQNNYNLFKATYIKKGNKPVVEDGDEYNFSPEGYKQFLITAYVSALKSKSMDESTRKGKLHFYSECYLKRYNGDIQQVINKMEL